MQAVGLGMALIFVALLFWGLRRRPGPASDGKPRITVLVAARNEEESLPRCLESLAAQDYPRDFCEFVIIDDASADATPQIAQEYAKRDARFRLLRLEETARRAQGPKKRALAAGLHISRGQIILVTDADCAAPSRWISVMTACFGDDVEAVCGMVRYQDTESWWGRLASFEGLVNQILNAAVIGLGGALSCSGANFAYRRETFLDTGGFDTGAKSFSGDDDLLLQRMKARGKKIRFCFSAQACVETEGPEGIRAYWMRKRRHLSAGRRYALHWILLAGLIYLGCLASVLLAVFKVQGLEVQDSFIWIWAAFSLLLIFLFWRGAWRLESRGWMGWAVPAAILFPLNFVLLQPLTLLSAPSWKGRAREA